MAHYLTGVTELIDRWVDGWTATMWPEKQASFVYILRGHCEDPFILEQRGAPVIYVGMTDRPRQRMRAHARKWWWPAVDLGQSELVGLVDRDAARRMEIAEIADELPPMNVADRALAPVMAL